MVSNLSYIALRRWLALAAVLVIVAVTIAGAILVKQRSFLIEARTGGVAFTFSGGSNSWNFSKAVLCTPHAVPLRSAGDQEDVCASSIYATKDLNDVTLTWRDGSRVDVTVDIQQNLSIKSEANTPGLLEPGALLIVPSDVWKAQGALTFQGYAIIGTTMATGTRTYLRGGRWEARVEGIANAVFGRVMDIAKNGELTRGASVRVIRDEKPALVYGHLTAGSGDQFLNISLISEAGDTEMHLNHYGLSEPAVIRTDWIDSTLASPFLLAIVAILTVAALFIQITGDVREHIRSDDRS